MLFRRASRREAEWNGWSKRIKVMNNEWEHEEATRSLIMEINKSARKHLSFGGPERIHSLLLRDSSFVTLIWRWLHSRIDGEAKKFLALGRSAPVANVKCAGSGLPFYDRATTRVKFVSGRKWLAIPFSPPLTLKEAFKQANVRVCEHWSVSLAALMFSSCQPSFSRCAVVGNVAHELS